MRKQYHIFSTQPKQSWEINKNVSFPEFWLSVPHFNESLLSYASAPWPHPQRHYLSFTEFEITFRPSAPNGTLLYCQDANSSDFLSVTLVDGHVEFRFDCGSGAAVLR